MTLYETDGKDTQRLPAPADLARKIAYKITEFYLENRQRKYPSVPGRPTDEIYNRIRNGVNAIQEELQNEMEKK